MDSTEKLENKSVTSIVHDLDKYSEKSQKKRENTLISFAIKAIARDQEKNIIISKLRRDGAKMRGLLNLLEMENDVKEQLMKEKENIIESLEKELRMLRTTENYMRDVPLNGVPSDGELPSKGYNLTDLVISTQSNIVALPMAQKHGVATRSIKQEPAEQQVVDPGINSPKPKAKLVKKKSVKRTKETHVTSFLYNLRNKTKIKGNGKE